MVAQVSGRTLLCCVRLMSSQMRLSSVTLVHPTHTVEHCGNILYRLTAYGLGQFVLKFWKEIRRDSR